MLIHQDKSIAVRLVPQISDAQLEVGCSSPTVKAQDQRHGFAGTEVCGQVLKEGPCVAIDHDAFCGELGPCFSSEHGSDGQKCEEFAALAEKRGHALNLQQRPPSLQCVSSPNEEAPSSTCWL